MELQTLRDGFERKWQQGDVIIRKVAVDVAGFEPVKGRVLIKAKNAHVVDGGKISRSGDALFVSVKKKAVFSHEASDGAHDPIEVGPGTYFIEPIVEVDFLSDMVRPVVD